MWAFENTWCIVGLIVLTVGLRVLFARHDVLRSHRPVILEVLDSLLIAVLLVFCILRPFVVQAFYIPSGSMEPGLQQGDRLLVNKFVYFFREPKVGDIVVFDAPPNALYQDSTKQKKDFIKRVVGVPGDHIAVRENRLYRNGVPVVEPYIKEAPTYGWPDVTDPHAEVVVPPGHLLMFGDNRNDSNDGHLWRTMNPDGSSEPSPFLPRANVLGKATFTFWPWYRVGVLH